MTRFCALVFSKTEMSNSETPAVLLFLKCFARTIGRIPCDFRRFLPCQDAPHCAFSGEELATFSADEVEGSLVGGFSRF